MRTIYSVAWLMRLVPLVLAAAAFQSPPAASTAGSAQTRHGQLRGVQLNAQRQLSLAQQPQAFAPASAPVPGTHDAEMVKPPQLLKDIPEPPPPPVQPPPEPPLPPLPPTEGTLVGVPPPLPKFALSIYPESATYEADDEFIAASTAGGSTSDAEETSRQEVVTGNASTEGGASNVTEGVAMTTSTTEPPPIVPPHAPIHAAAAPPELPDTTTATTTQTLFPQAAPVVPPDCAEVAKAVAEATAAGATLTTTLEPGPAQGTKKGCASKCQGICVEEKQRELASGPFQTVDATLPLPCQDKAANTTRAPPVEPLAAPDPPPPLPAVLGGDILGMLQRASR